MMLTSISLWPLVRQTTPQIITIVSHISKLCITCFGTPALITCPCLLSRGPWNLWDLHSGHSAQGTLVLWAPISFLLTGITWLLTFCDVCKISIISTQSWSSQDRTRMDPMEINWKRIQYHPSWTGALHCTTSNGFLLLMLGSSCQCMHIKQCIALSNGKNTNCAETRNAFPSQSWSESKRDVERYDLLRRQWQLKPVKLLNQVRSQSFIGSTGWLPKSRQLPFKQDVLGVCQFVYFLCLHVCLVFYLFVILFIWCISLIVSCVCCLILLASNIHRDNISGYP